MVKKILAVDDDRQILELEKKILSADGFQVMTTTDGHKAVALMKEHAFAVVLLDISMPEMDGFQVSQSLRRAAVGTMPPVVFVTANDDSESMRKGFRSGGTIFLSKPFTANQLLRVVRSIAAK